MWVSFTDSNQLHRVDWRAFFFFTYSQVHRGETLKGRATAHAKEKTEELQYMTKCRDENRKASISVSCVHTLALSRSPRRPRSASPIHPRSSKVPPLSVVPVTLNSDVNDARRKGVGGCRDPRAGAITLFNAAHFQHLCFSLSFLAG